MFSSVNNVKFVELEANKCIFVMYTAIKSFQSCTDMALSQIKLVQCRLNRRCWTTAILLEISIVISGRISLEMLCDIIKSLVDVFSRDVLSFIACSCH